MTTADKKRILKTPGVKGEIKIQNMTFEFRVHSNGEVYMLDGYSWRKNKSVHIKVTKNKLVLWDYLDSKETLSGNNSLFFLELKAMINYTDVKILWCIYPGIETKEAA